MILKEIIDALEKIAPVSLKENWDNVGLMVGSPGCDVRKVLVCLDITDEVIEQAVAGGANLIVCHHPLLFKPLESITDATLQGRYIANLIKNEISVYSMHTNFDSCQAGLNDFLADMVGIADARAIKPIHYGQNYKLVTFIPREHFKSVQEALCEAGAGVIGNYDYCTFRTGGIGSFRGSEDSSPFVGEAGKYEEADEVRLELLVPKGILHQCLQAMLEVHPYDEPDYDVYPLEQVRSFEGLGRFGKLKNPVKAREVVGIVKEKLECDNVVTVGDLDKSIQLAAVCSGSGGNLIEEVSSRGCDFYLTGELNYHQALFARGVGMVVVAAGHYFTERPFVKIVSSYLTKRMPNLEVVKCYLPGSPFSR